MKLYKIVCLTMAMVTVLSVSACGNKSASDKNTDGNYAPAKNVTMFSPYKAGGAVDLLGRNIGAVMTNKKLVDCNFVYENQEGASGQVGLNVVAKQHDGDENLLIPVSSTYITLQKIQGGDYSYQDLTMVAQFGVDYNLIVVNAASPYQTMEELVAAGQEGELVVAASGTGAISHIIAERIKMETDMQVRVLPCDGSSEQIVSILGNQVDFSCNNPAEVGQYVESGELRALAVTSAERLEDFPDVPTLTECGINVTENVSRGLAMPANVSKEARAYWEDKAKALFESEEFQTQYIQANSMTAEFLTGEEYTKKLDEQYAIYDEVLEKIGLKK